MYYEEAIVKTYYRNYKNKKVPYNQIHLKKDSKFNENPEEPDIVGVIKLPELEELFKNNGIVKLNELEAKYNELQEEKLQLEKKIEEYEKASKSLASDVNELTKEKVQLQEDLLTEKNKHEELIEAANNNVVEAKDTVINLQEEQKQEVKELNSKLEEANNKIEKLLIVINNKDNDIVYLAKRGLGSRIRNKLTERIEATIIEVEAKTSEE